MTAEHWYRFGLGQDVTATVVFTNRPTADDLASLSELLETQIRVLKRASSCDDERADDGR